MKYYSKIDTLRAFAILAVMFSHWIPKGDTLLSTFPFGFWGVNLFFVISGFLITGILLKSRFEYENDVVKSKTKSILTFVYRRSLRIFPLYYLTLIPFFLFDLSGFRTQYINHILYLSNIQFYLENSMQGALSPRWSLAVEEQFYLVWPFLVMYLPTKYFARTFLAIILFAFVFRTGLQFLYPDRIYYQFLTFSNIDSLSAGAVLALLNSKYSTLNLRLSQFLKLKYVMLSAFVLLSAFVVMFLYLDKNSISLVLIKNLSFTLFNFSLVMLVVKMNEEQSFLLDFKPLQYIGKISYGLYLYHSMVNAFTHNSAFLKPYFANVGLKIIILLGVNIAIASLSWYFFEKPILRLKDKFKSV